MRLGSGRGAAGFCYEAFGALDFGKAIGVVVFNGFPKISLSHTPRIPLCYDHCSAEYHVFGTWRERGSAMTIDD